MLTICRCGNFSKNSHNFPIASVFLLPARRRGSLGTGYRCWRSKMRMMGQSGPQVRPRLVAAHSWRATLAWCTSASRVQTRRHGVQLAAWTSTPVPVGFLPTDLRRRSNISAPPADDNWSCHATGSAPMAEGHLPWPVRRCGTLCLTIWEIQLLAVIASDARWKRFCLRRTETCSAFGVLQECAIQIYFYLLTGRKDVCQ